ncbi:MAG: hypothetical protein LBE17_02350, partial [Treponema sp.]|nr:hypothetical protein [Treponema sp.]
AAPHIAGTDFDICVPAPESGAVVPAAHHNGRCVYRAGRNLVVCPVGKPLYPSFYKKSTGQGVFSNQEACKNCGCTCRRKGGGGVIKFLWRRRTFQRSMMIPAWWSNK